jgi:predicted Rossmann fold flavoprotein
MNQFDLVVIGGGAAGFYGAIQAATLQPGLRILILEKTNKLLSKVRVSGGGRCNVTHHCFQPVALSHHYPRGEKQLQPVFKSYHATHVVEWFASKGVKLKTEEDGRMFPVTDDSETIIQCFLTEAEKHKIKICSGEAAEKISPTSNSLTITTDRKIYHSKNVLIAIGGSPKIESYNIVAALGHTIKSPIPSLFTFNDAQKDFQDLMGIAVPNAEVKIAGTKFIQQGPLLITHWGLSGPAVIKLSAWAAEHLHQQNYMFSVLVSWIGSTKEEILRDQLLAYQTQHGKQRVIGNPLFKLPIRLWERLCERAAVDSAKIWSELPVKNLNKLLENLMRCTFTIKGKTTFKEEFVTCGGIDLSEVDLQTMESKKIPGIYFAGETLNIDGETGGFNFQGAWSTAYTAAKAIAEKER